MLSINRLCTGFSDALINPLTPIVSLLCPSLPPTPTPHVTTSAPSNHRRSRTPGCCVVVWCGEVWCAVVCLRENAAPLSLCELSGAAWQAFASEHAGMACVNMLLREAAATVRCWPALCVCEGSLCVVCVFCFFVFQGLLVCVCVCVCVCDSTFNR